jgi:hypothetical protein
MKDYFLFRYRIISEIMQLYEHLLDHLGGGALFAF